MPIKQLPIQLAGFLANENNMFTLLHVRNFQFVLNY